MELKKIQPHMPEWPDQLFLIFWAQPKSELGEHASNNLW